MVIEWAVEVRTSKSVSGETDVRDFVIPLNMKISLLLHFVSHLMFSTNLRLKAGICEPLLLLV